MRRGAAIILAAGLLLGLTACQTRTEYMKEKAETVKACVDGGGEWYNDPGWGESCHFDTRKDKK